MKWLARLHGTLVFDRRTRVLSERLAALLPAGTRVLDVGCGDGSIDRLSGARRVARQTVVLKDHTRDGLLAGPTLRFMDWVGNAPHGIPLPYNYWPERRWREAFARLGLTPAIWLNKLGLYPTPATWFFDRSLHFVARLDKV